MFDRENRRTSFFIILILFLFVRGQILAEEVWVAPSQQNDQTGNWSGDKKATRFSFAVPDDMTAFQEATVLLIGKENQDIRYSLFLSVSQNLLPHDISTSSRVSLPAFLYQDELVALDVSPVFADQMPFHPGSDYLSLRFESDAPVKIIGLRFRYETGPAFDPADYWAKTDIFGGDVMGPGYNLQLRPDVVGAFELQASAVGSDEIATGAVVADKIAGNAVGPEKIASSAVGSPQLADSAVTRPKIALDAVGQDQLGNAVVSTEKIRDLSVTRPKIALAAVGSDQIADQAVGTGHLADLSVTAPKLDAASVTGEKISAGAVSTPHLQDAAITTSKLAAASVTGDKVAASAIGTFQLQNGAINNPKLAAASVTASKVAPDTIATFHLLDAAVTSSKLADASVTNSKVAANSIGSFQLLHEAVTADKIAMEAVGLEHLRFGSVGSPHIMDGQVRASDVDPSQVQLRVDGSCPPGQSIRQISENGAVVCEVDSVGLTELTYTSSVVTCPAASACEFDLSCSLGRVVSGGCRVSPGNPSVTHHSSPISMTAWRVRLEHSSPSPQSYQCMIICAR